MKWLFFTALIVPFTVLSQRNATIIDSTSNEEILYGLCNKEALLLPVFMDYYTQFYAEYSPDKAILTLLSTDVGDYKILIFMGSWCSDSQEQLPRFFKVAETIGFPEDRIEIYAVDRKKHCSGIEALIQQYGLERVPTIIFIRGDKELGRITETPLISIEADWLKIIEQ